MYYSIRHLTKFRYSAHVSESLMEARMQPRSDGPQRCLSFQLMVQPKARVQYYRDYLGNMVHHFDVPGRHKQLSIVADALVDVQPALALPASLGENAWDELDDTIAAGDYIEMLMPSHFGQSTELLEQFACELDVESREKSRQRDPLDFVLNLNAQLYSKIAYVPKSTRVDSPIDHALESRQGVCQDFAHGHADRPHPAHWNSPPLRFGLPVPQGGRKDALGRRRHPRLGGNAAPGFRLDRPGSNQQRAGQRAARAQHRWGAIMPMFLPPRACLKASAESQLLVSVHRSAIRTRRRSSRRSVAKTGPRHCARRVWTRSCPITSSSNSSSNSSAGWAAAIGWPWPYFVPLAGGVAGAALVASSVSFSFGSSMFIYTGCSSSSGSLPVVFTSSSKRPGLTKGGMRNSI